MADIRIFDQDGNVMVHKPPAINAIANAGAWRDSVPYDAARNYGQRMGNWNPFLWSPDGEINMFRDRMVSRSRDLVRNDGWASGSISQQTDNIVGANFRPMSKPDYRSLATYSGIRGFDYKWAEEFGAALEANWRDWAEDSNYYCDAQRCLSFSQIARLAFRHKLIDGDCIALMLWQPKNIGIGKTRYATQVQLIDPDRLSNPSMQYDNKDMRGGVKVGHLGEPLGYYIRRAHVGDWFNAGDSVMWDYIERETPWGRPVVVHDYDHDRAAQHRGGVGVLTPVLERMKMLGQYDGTELDAAIINAIFGAYIKSPYDPEVVGTALGNSDELTAYQGARAGFHKDNSIGVNGARLPILFPGEDIIALKSERPNTAFDGFQRAMLRSIASATGTSYEQLARDWSTTNYSSARAAILETWKTFGRRRKDFSVGFCQPIFSCVAEESFEMDDLPLPAGAPDFAECRRAYSNAMWIGPGKGWVDPVKEKQGAMLGIEAGLSTLEQECAESGTDWRDNIAQRAREIVEFKRLGINPPAAYAAHDEVISTEKLG